MKRLLFPSLIRPVEQDLRLEAFMILNKSWTPTSVRVVLNISTIVSYLTLRGKELFTR